MNARLAVRSLLRNALGTAGVVAFALAARTQAGSICDPQGPWRQELVLGGFAADVEAVAWSPDGSQVAAGGEDEVLALFDSRTGEQVRTFPARACVVASVAWSPDGARLATGTLGGRVWIWSAESGELQATIAGGGRSAYSVGWSPEGDRLAFGSGTAVEIWTQCTEGAAR